MLKSMNALEEQARAAAAKVESERVTGTKPSLALNKYAGYFHSDLSADVRIEITIPAVAVKFDGDAFLRELREFECEFGEVIFGQRHELKLHREFGSHFRFLGENGGRENQECEKRSKCGHPYTNKSIS